MNVVSLKDYAKQNHISYEAVRQQVVRYKNELGAHIIQDGRQQFLDEEAVAFLDSKRQKNPVVVYQQDKDEQIDVLKKEIEKLLAEKTAYADKVAALSEWKAEKALEIAEADSNKKLLEAAAEEKKLLQAQNDDLRGDLKKKDEILDKERETSQKLSQELSDALQREKDKDKRIEELENRTFGDYLKGLFRKKGNQR